MEADGGGGGEYQPVKKNTSFLPSVKRHGRPPKEPNIQGAQGDGNFLCIVAEISRVEVIPGWVWGKA
jgi:hypothetical protein